MRERARGSSPTSGVRVPAGSGTPGAFARLGAALAAFAALAFLAFLAAPPAHAAPAPGTSILNTASGSGFFVGGSEPFVRSSNTVRAIVEAPPVPVPPTLAFYTAADFATVTRFGSAGTPLWLEANAPQCNTRPAVADTIALTVTSNRGLDAENVIAVETGPSTGRFRVTPALPTAPAAGLPTSAVGDAVLSLARGDVVTAMLFGCGAAMTEAVLWIEPAGLVFAARDGTPVAGASITLVDVTGAGNGGVPGGPARVFAADGVTPAANPVTSDAGGRFAFPLAAAGTYRLEVAPPASYRFPSIVPPAQVPAGFLVDAAGSYGAVWATGGLAPVVLDVPLDFEAGDVLFVETRALRAYAELGEGVDFAVRVANRSSAAIDSIVVVDRLPYGFAFVPGTLRLAGADAAAIAARPLAVLPGGDGTVQSFAVGGLAAGETIELRFRTRVGAAAMDAEPVNRAGAFAPGVNSNEASTTLELAAGPFTREGTVLGSVFVDTDGDGRPGPGDPALAGVRIWLDDGTFAITDADGRYSLYGIAPRTRALKLDRATLPAGARVTSDDPRDAGAPGLRFVDLTLGDLVRVDFAVGGDTAVVTEARSRASALAAAGRGELTRAVVRGGDALAPAEPARDPRALPASAIVTGEERLPLFRGAPASLAAARRAKTGGRPLEELLPALDSALGFVDFAPLDTVGQGQVVVRVKGPATEAGFRLEVNEVEISAARVGKKVSAPEAGVEAWEFVGVRLHPGANTLVVRGAGDEAVRAVVVAPDRPARLALIAPPTVPADGFTPATLELRLDDAAGVPVGARTLITLEATFGRIVADDLDPLTVGTQVALEGGAGTIGLAGQGTPGVALVSARTAAGLEAMARVAFVPDLRPALAVGAFEGLVSLSGDPGGRPPDGVLPKPLFESEPVAFVSRSADGKALAAVRGSAFYKGRVKDDLLLTLGYDSERAPRIRAFRDLQPDAYYPLYGDGSVRGFEGQSTRPLYARLDRRGASLLYGDFVTPGAGGARTLSAYSRSLNGVAGQFEDARLRVSGWSSRERSRRQVDEIRGRGISGPYVLTVVPLVDGSERVEVIVRDRNQPAVVLSSSARQRFSDYAIDARTGEILMKAPVPSVDGELNPVFLRVSYEVEDGGEPFWTTGFEARVRPGARFELGGSYVDDHDPSGAREIRSIFAAAKTGARSTFEAEFATTHAGETGRRDAGGRVEWRHAATGIEARVHAAATGDDFANPTSGYAAGRIEGGGRLSAVLSPRTRLIGEALYSGDASGGARRGGLLVALDRALGERVRGELGARVAAGVAADGTDEELAATVRAKLSARVPAARELDAHVEIEQDTQVFDRRLVALGAEMRVLPRVRAYGRHEFVGGRLEPWELSGARQHHRTVFGLDANVTPEARLFSEYRMDGAIGGRDGEAVIGLRNAWRLRSGARITGSLERVQAIGAVPAGAIDPGASFAAAIGVDYAESPWWKGSARSEFRVSRASEGILTTLAGGLRIDRSWSGLLRNHLSLMSSGDGARNDRERLQLGVAYRPGTAWDGLARYELRWDRDGGGTPAAGEIAPADLRRLAHVLSLHGAGPLGGRTRGALAWAAKWVDEGTDGWSTSSAAHWVHGRTTWTLGSKYDAGLRASLWEASHSRRGGLGVELGRRLDDAVWLSLGFNRFGYSDDELTGEEYTRQGVYFRIRAKFDETLFARAESRP